MSWYNDLNSGSFIDATQEIIGGDTIVTATTEVQNTEDLVITETTPDVEEETTIGNVLLPAVFNQEEGTYDLYIRNVNQGGRIFFTTRGDGEQVKIDDGKLYVYYYYNPIISAIIPSGWTNVANYLVANRQGINNNSAGLVGLGGLIGAIELDLNTNIRPLLIEHTAAIGTIELELEALKNGEIFDANEANREDLSDTIFTINSYRDTIANSYFQNLPTYSILNAFRKLTKSRAGLLISGGLAIAFGGYVGASLTLLGYIYDFFRIEEIKEEIKILQKVSYNIETHTDKNVVDKLDVSGLAINQLTNTGGLTDGIYEIQSPNSNGDDSLIEITVSSGIASITNVLEVGNGYSIGDTIIIPKSELGGNAGNLEINVNQVFSSLHLIGEEVDAKINELNEIKGRQRRREFIPDKNSFGDGINVVETNVTEPSGEITKELDIKLKVDTNQFQYDGSGNLQIQSSILAPSISTDPAQFITDPNTGNLQIIDYDKIAEIGDDTVGAETGLYQYVLNKIDEALGDQETYDANGNVVVPATNIYQEINNIYELVMVGDQTFYNNNDYKLNLGYKTIWTGYAYDLITIALKAVRAGIFDSSFYNNDWLGYFPSLTRISDDEYMSVVRDANVEILNNLTFKKGLVYFKQNDPVVDYDLNRKFEFVCFIRPQDVDNAGVEYTLLQTGIRLPNNEYELDTSKLKLGFRDNKFEITHNVRREIEYYAALTYKNYENSPPVFYPTTYINNQTTGETSRQSIYYDVERYFGVIDQQTYAPFFDWTIMLRRTININFSYAINFGISMYDMNFNTLKSMANPATDTWASPKIIYKEPLTIQQPRNGVAKIVVAFEYFVAPSQGNTLQLKTFTSVADIDQNLEFKWRINLKKVGDPAIYGSRIYDFDQFQYHSSYNPTSPNHLGFYVQELWLPQNTYPLWATDRYNYIELELVHRGGATFAPLPVGTQSYNFYNGQHSIRLHAVNFFDYDVSPDTFVDHSVVTFQDTTDFIPTPIDANKWHKVVAELDLPNKVVQYWVDDVNNYFTFDTTIDNIPHSSLQLPNSDPTIPYFYSAEYEFTSQGYTTLVSDNDIIVIGNEPSQGQLQYTHFAWKHFQDPLEYYMTQAERDKLDILINYNYYYETVKVDRYLKVKEFYADVLDARKILVNGGFAYTELSPGDQINQLKSADQSSDNVAITNAFVNIDKLFVSDPVASGNGFLSYNATTKEFTIGSSTISSADVENAVGSLVKISPSTYGLVFNQSDPLDKYLQIDDVYINNLINLVIQNELILTNAFTDNTYGDVLIQIKDASVYSPYNLRELEDTDVRYNYKINGNHQYLYRELNQEIQYDPLLGTAFGDLYPVVMYHFQGEIINNARDWLTGIPASDYDFEMLTQGGQVVYGSGPLNMKNFNGVEGGNTIIRTKNVMAISSAFRTCISFFHKPFASNVDGTDDHVLVKFVDVNNYPVFYIKLEYVSNNAIYKLVFVNPGNIADETSFTFNNSENEIYFGNENCILLWCDQPYWHFYINGKYHGVSINQTYTYGASGIRDCKISIDLNYFNNRSLLYELKVYPKLLFKTASGGNLSSTDLTFNNKVVVDVTEMIRIITFNTGGFIIKELSGVQETKARSITTKVRSLDTQRRVGVVETKLPATGTGTKGFIYSDGVNENYNLENPLDLTAVSTTSIALDDRKILTFKEIPNGADFDIKILSRSITSMSQRDKLIDYSYLGITPLTIYDDPYPPYEYTFLLSYIENRLQNYGYFFQFETNIVGQPIAGGSSGISFQMQVLGGDIIKYSGASGVWGIYRMRDFVYTLITTLNDGDEFLADNYKYRLDSLYFRKNNDPNTQIRIFIYGPYLFADKIDLGQEYNMISALSSQHTEPIKNWNFISSSSRKKYNHIMTDSAGTIRPLFVTPGEKVITTNGMPSDEDTYFKWSWGINYTQIACLMESGDLLLNGDVYVNCPTNAPFDMNTGILINRIDNLVSPDRASITGIPPLVEQVYYIELTSWDRTNFIAYFSGTDRINTYNNQVVSQFEFYYDDTIEISLSASVLADIQTYQYHGVSIQTPSTTVLLNANNIVTHKFLKSFGSNPYVEVSFGFNYQLNQMNRINIPINLQDIVDYHNEAFLTTDEYILKYKPHTNTFVWEENIGMALDTGQEETAIPIGSFKAKTATTQISSRRTLAPSVPIEKISQKTKYQVFNTEVEVNGNVLLEEVNADVGSLFTIYTNEEKTIGGVSSFKDRASIILKDSTNEWIFKREPESENIQLATTKFIHDTTTLLTLKHNEVDVGVDLKVSKIIFGDNSILETAPTDGSGFDLSIRNDYPYIYTNTQVINQNNNDGTWQYFELNSDASNPVYMNYLRHYPSNNDYNKPENIIHFYTNYDDTGFWFGRFDSANSQWKQWLHINDFELFTDRNIKLNKRATDAQDPKIIFHDGTSISSFSQIETEVLALGDSLNLAFNTNLAGQVLVLQNQITQNATNIATNTSDLTALNNDISTTHPDYVEFAKNIKLPNGDIISAGPLNGVDGVDGTNGVDGVDGTNGVDGADGLGFTGGSYNSSTGVVTFASNDGLGFSTGDLRASYTDADARSAVYPINQTNSGLSIINAGINIFDNGLWFNSIDGRNRFNFDTDGNTYIRTPLIDGNHISLQHGASDRFYTGHTINTSAVDLQIGDGNTNPAQLFLRGTNNQTLSSAVIFADNNASNSDYYQGMMIYYDSYQNKLKISGDTDFNNVVDTPPAISILRGNRHVGILKETPSFPLDVEGNANISGQLSTTQITFSGDNSTLTSANIDYNNLVNKPTLANVATSGSYNDLSNQPTIPTIPSYLFEPAIWKYRLKTITNVNYPYTGSSNNFPWIFGTGSALLLNLNSPVQINTGQELKILTAGYYQIHISFRFRNNQGNNAMRAAIQNFLEINGTFAVDRVATTYMRNTGSAECACTNQACLVEYFNVNDLVRVGFMKIGNSTNNCELFGDNSTITFQRIA